MMGAGGTRLGWGFRKSTKIGGVRLTFSKSGVSMSVGGKGFRVTSGPRGMYVTTGFGGFYYRQRIGGGAARPAVATPPQRDSSSPELYATQTYASASVEQLSDISQDEFVTSLNEWTRRGFLQVACVLAIVLAFVIAIASDARAQVLGELGAYSVIAFCLARFIENRRRRFLLVYDLGAEEQARYERMSAAIAEFAQSGSFRAVKMVGHLGDWKRNAGATRALTFESASLYRAVPRHIVTNIVPWALHVQGMELYFFPDRLLIRSRRRFAALAYAALDLSSTESKFVWDEPLPHDAQVIGHTWQYVRKDGGPDRRFKGNREIPVVLVGVLELRSATGLEAAIQTTRVVAAQNVARAVASYGADIRAAVPRRADLDPAVRNALATFGLDEVPRLGELKRLYRELAQRNHPDKFANARRELQMFAAQRMQEIVDAYEVLLEAIGTSENAGAADAKSGESSLPQPTNAMPATPAWRSAEALASYAAVLAATLVFAGFRATPASDVRAPAPVRSVSVSTLVDGGVGAVIEGVPVPVPVRS